MEHKLPISQIVFLFFFLISLFGMFGEENPFPLTPQNLSQGPVYSILGWGDEGKMAYWVAVPASVSRTSPYIRFYVRDLVDDIFLYQSRILNLKNGNDWLLAADILRRDWQTIQRRYALETPEFKTADQNFTYLGSNYEVYLDTEVESLADGLKSWALYIRMDQKKIKLVQAFMKKRSQTEKLRNIAVKDVLISPLEKRAAIILTLTWEKEGRAWTEMIISGAHLSLGFEMPRKDNTLTEAVLNGQFYIVRMLLEKGVDPEGDGMGKTPLEYAVEAGFSDIAELLLENGANPDCYSSRPLIKIAAEKQMWDVVRLMKQKGADSSSISGLNIP